jgi:2-polyprenyl-3-methyl-5-hydroxy-6-metoxy-1,4-benzoquinol methylase
MIDNPNYTKFVNKTYSKPFSIRQSLPKIVMEHVKKTDKILDYGAGKDIFGTKMLRDNGFDCTAWEIGENFNPQVHNYHALDGHEYDVIFASNVLNVQPDNMAFIEILEDVQRVLKDGGLFFCNFPLKPRHNTLTIPMVESTLRLAMHTHDDYGGHVDRLKSLVWKCVYKR